MSWPARPDAKVAREIICTAACTVTGARFAKLMERSPDGEIVMTAKHGLESSPPLTVPLGEEASGADAVFLSKKPLFVEDARGDDRLSQRVVSATGAVSMHFEPALRNEEAVAVLVVGWTHAVDEIGSNRGVDAHARRGDRNGARAPRPAGAARGGRADR